MNVLTLRPQIEIGGVRTGITNVCSGLIQRGHNSIIGAAQEETPEYFEQRGIPTASIPLYPSTPSNLLMSVSQIIGLIKAEKIDVMHSTHRFSSIIGRIVNRLTNIPLVVSIHEIKEDKRFLSSLWTSNFNIVPSQALRSHLVTYYGLSPNKINVISNGIDPVIEVDLDHCNELRRTLPFDNNCIMLGYIGRLSSEKGVRFFIDSVALLLSQNQQVKALIVGGGPEETALRNQVADLQIEDSVIFLGMRDDIPELLEIIDIMILPSISESFGTAALEAMRASRPVIATSSGGLPEVVKDGFSGRIVPPESPIHMAEAISELILNPEVGRTYGRNGRESIFKEYTIDKMVEGYITVFTEAINSR